VGEIVGVAGRDVEVTSETVAASVLEDSVERGFWPVPGVAKGELAPILQAATVKRKTNGNVLFSILVIEVIYCLLCSIVAVWDFIALEFRGQYPEWLDKYCPYLR
jgi:hypothetical protein